MDPDKVNLLKEKGNKAFLEQKYDEALDFYKEALESVGSEDSKVAAILHSNIAQTHLKKKDYSRAIKHATESLKLDPSFMKSNLRRATANAELNNLVDAMNDLRVVFLHEPTNKTAEDLMKRCSDKPKMKRELHEAYAKHYLSILLMELGAQAMIQQSDIHSGWLQDALLRQLFLSMEGLNIANYFFCGASACIDSNNGAMITFLGWIARQFMWFGYSFTSITIGISAKLFKLVHCLLRPKTFSLTIVHQNSMNEETLLLNKYSEVLLVKEGLLLIRTVDDADLKLMNYYSDDITNLLYTPGLANFKINKFPSAKTLVFDPRHAVTDEFLKLWKKNKWPIESLSFIRGVPDLRVLKKFKQSNGVVSSKVNKVFTPFAQNNNAFNKIDYNKLCNNLSILKSVFPGLSDVLITQRYVFEAQMFPQFVQDMPMIREAYETISTKPEWCSKLKVVIFVDFMADVLPDFMMFDVKLLEQSVESFRKKHLDMKIRLSGPRSYNNMWARSFCVHAVVEFENDVASFEFAYYASLDWEDLSS